ncbi:hypothetical protein I203_105108 [Kwoniella mangroviensis CBS 8507]|uniref:uncharacterized protein n=1 Tax=Kwoniella mangroviensis CBS 8507 TaxID=1296122 RepID=UPI003027CB18
MSQSSFRLNWEAEPSLTFTLLTLIKSNPLYQHVFFSTSIEQVKDKYLVSQKICIEFFKDSVWMKDAERRGLVIKTEAGEWKATKKWGSNVANPITSRVLHLRKRFNDGWYKTKRGILHNNTKIEDIPDRRKRVLFGKQHPYYFILRELCQGQQPQAGLPVMTPVEEPPDPPTRRRKRSPSTISSDSSDSEGNVPLAAHAASPLLKDLEIPPQNETQVFRFGMRPNIAYSDDSNSDSDSEASSASDSSFICELNTRPQDRTPGISVTPPSPAPSDSPSVVALSCTSDQWEQPKIIRSPPDKEP